MNSNLEGELDPKKLEQNVLFIAIYINRINTSQENDDTVFALLNTLFSYVDLSVIALNLPNLFQVNDQFMAKYDFNAFDSSSSARSKLSHVHLYDFIQLSVLRFFSKLNKLDSVFYYLCNNLTLKFNKKHSIRLVMSSDLIESLFALNLNNEKLAVSVLKFVSELYEMDAKENPTNAHLKLTLYKLFNALVLNSSEKKCRSTLKTIHDFYSAKKCFMCFSVFYSSISSFQHQSKFFCDYIDPKNSSVNSFLVSLFKQLASFFNGSSIDSLRPNAFQLGVVNIFGFINLESVNFTSNKALSEQGAHLVRVLHEYFEKKSTESSFNNSQVYKRSLTIFYKIILKLNLNSEVEFLLSLFLKNYSKMNVNLKYQLVNFLYSILIAKGKSSTLNDLQVIIGKIVDSICLILSEASSENLKIFCLECLNENMPGSASPSPIMSAILCSLTRKNKALNEQIMNYLVDVKPSMTLSDEAQYLSEQFACLSQSTLFRPTRNQKVTMLDDTMNVLMAMEATQTGARDCELNEDQDPETNEEARIECENKIEDLTQEVNGLFDLLKAHYTDKNQPIPECLRSKVNNLVELITLSI
jgi:hypothetical protein